MFLNFSKSLWSLSYHLVFNWLNARNDFRLFKFWAKLTLEQPAKSDRDYQVAGLGVADNKRFWMKEDAFNHLCNRAINWYIIVLSLALCSQLFFVECVIDPLTIFTFKKKHPL